jgi:hypothetical protein
MKSENKEDNLPSPPDYEVSMSEDNECKNKLLETPIENVKFAKWVQDNEITEEVARHLLSVLTRVGKIILLVDDSGSMQNRIIEPNGQSNLFSSAVGAVTRWGEAQKAAATLITMLTSIPNHGLDVWFMNRPSIYNVMKIDDLASSFNTPPGGNTPLIKTLNTLFRTYDQYTSEHILLLVISDGEPSDGSVNDLFRCLKNKHPLFHVSFIECNDNEEEMAFMDSLDGLIQNFHNSDDYRMEVMRVKQQQGSDYSFTYVQYIIASILSTFIPKYFLLDQQKSSRITITPLPSMETSQLNSLMYGVVCATRVKNTNYTNNYQNNIPNTKFAVGNSPSDDECCCVLL